MKLTVIVRPYEKVEIENVTLFGYDSRNQTLEYWIGPSSLNKITNVLGVFGQKEEE